MCKDGVMLTVMVVASLLSFKCLTSCLVLRRGLRVSDDQDYSVRIQVLTPKEFKNPEKFDHGSISTKSISTVRQFDVASLACPSRALSNLC